MSVPEQLRLPPEVNRILFVRNLPAKMSQEELYDVFGRFGAIRQIRRGIAPDTKGSAFVVYEDIYDAKNAVDHLKGLCVGGRYLAVHYFKRDRMVKRMEIRRAKQELENIKSKLGGAETKK
mmetsp:Transcript_23470/g.41609  ORF Transcript_23470/g.41609 Transcript_23470/m.41609 type:complete len:121 (-) Transcript_23470:332-694(-)